MQDRVVMFADVLGFTALIENNELDTKSIKALSRLYSSNLYDLIEAHENPLTRTFSGFHQELRFRLDQAQMRHPLTAITFSDSVFISTAHLFEAVNIAIGLLQSLLSQKIPMRIGIAHGSFAAVRFRSDITDDSGDHAAQFLGTGVVRSYATEECGIKGMRILLHPSAMALMGDPVHNPQVSGKEHLHIMECPAEECSNKAGVGHEVDYWHFRPTAEAQAWHALQDMWAAAPQVALNHYQATAEAIDRMRVRQGEEPLAKLRRRTLPRRK